jgi:hypothetical protein
MAHSKKGRRRPALCHTRSIRPHRTFLRLSGSAQALRSTHQHRRTSTVGPQALVPETAWRVYLSVARFALAAIGTFGTRKSRETRREPHWGHMRRLSSRESGKFGPRVLHAVPIAERAARRHPSPRLTEGPVDYSPPPSMFRRDRSDGRDRRGSRDAGGDEAGSADRSCRST